MMKLLIISHTPHYRVNETVVGWGSTIREIDRLAELFDEVVHLAPLYPGDPSRNDIAYTHNNVNFIPVQPAGGHHFFDKFSIFLKMPSWIRKIRTAVKEAEAIHIRCPAGISLVALGIILLHVHKKPVWVKYAGDWDPKSKPSLSYRIQRSILRKTWRNVTVTVNGQWPHQNEHVVSFKNPSLTSQEYQRAKIIASEKSLSFPIRLLFVGRLDRSKGVDRLLQISIRLKEANLDHRLFLVGDSPERGLFEQIVMEQGLSRFVTFEGWQPITEVQKYYRTAHLFVFPSTSEGWPKVLSEAMAHGVVPIASAIGCIPQELENIGCGKTVAQDDLLGFTQMIQFYINNPDIWKAESLIAVKAGREYTYQAYLQSVRNLFLKHWKIEL
ncbi:glycosyltransferase [bacterium]|nr:glycosyltransferase [bacterium]